MEGHRADKSERFPGDAKVPHPNIKSYNPYREPGASEAGPGFKEKDRRSQKQQNNFVKYREADKCNVADLVLGIKIAGLIMNRMTLLSLGKS